MSAQQLYETVYQELDTYFEAVPKTTLERLTLLVVGMIDSGSSSPKRVATALAEMGLRNATAESLERQIRRLENDVHCDIWVCWHPFARARLLMGKPKHLYVIIDPTTKEDQMVLITIAVWYRGRALPLAWMVYPGNTPLKGASFWQRVERLLDQVKKNLLPAHVPVTWLADRAFGTPQFTDMVVARGWHYIVRVQGQTRCRDVLKRERRVDTLFKPGQKRAKMRGEVFKKAKWRQASVVVFHGRRHQTPLCLVSDLAPCWRLIAIYRQRYGIEASFRDYKSAGWQWELSQVVDLAHMERLLIGMALASWLSIMVGTQVAEEALNKSPSGRRRTPPALAKQSLFQLGLSRMKAWIKGNTHSTLAFILCDWDAPNWSTQITQHHAHAYVMGINHARKREAA